MNEEDDELAAEKKANEIAEGYEIKCIRSIMETQEGRHWVYEKLKTCGVSSTPFTTDSNLTSFNCGMQNIGLLILNEITTNAPTQYLRMMKEGKERDGRRDLAEQQRNERNASRNYGADFNR